MDNTWTKSDSPTVLDFFKSDLCKAGTLIKTFNPETHTEKTMLIGDINETGGTCDCCFGPGWTDKVIEHKVIYKKE